MGKEILEMLDCDKNGVASEEEISSATKIQELQERIRKIEELGDKALLDIDAILEDRLKKEQEESSNMEVRNVV